MKRKLNSRSIERLCRRMVEFKKRAKQIVMDEGYLTWRQAFDHFCSYYLRISPDLKTFEFENKKSDLRDDLATWFCRTFPSNLRMSQKTIWADEIDESTRIVITDNQYHDICEPLDDLPF